jgi:DNA-binding winged helix-turn-helix (wHTH) protein
MSSARFGPFTFLGDRRQLLHDDRDVHLTPKAFELLGLLVARAPAVVRKEDIHAHLWPGTFVSEATLLGVMKELRRALGDGQRDTLIRTVHRTGYALAVEVQSIVPPASSTGATCWVEIGRRKVTLAEGVNVIGRSPDSIIRLDAAGVSRRHALIRIEGGTAWLEDLGSKNGTLLGGRPLLRPLVLRDGDRIGLVSEEFVFRTSEAGMSTITVPRGSPGDVEG